MKRVVGFLLSVIFVLLSLSVMTGASASVDYEAKAKKLDKTIYSGTLGAIYSKKSTTFRVWAPTSSDVKVKFYKTGTGKDYTRLINMSFDKKTGVWSAKVSGDLKNTYYTYVFTRDKKTCETYDIYAKACAVNGMRSMVVDLDSTDPKGWNKDVHITVDNPTDALIWEVHIGDFSNSESSGVSAANRGKFLAFTEKGTTVESVAGGEPTCVDYLKHLGVNYVHINPFYDFGSVDETDKSGKDSVYNWGYDPVNYNIPEGSYSKDPTKGALRLKECKKMIQSLHKAGIGVIMDVVYNHTLEGEKSAFNLTVPDYYYRINSDGSWSNGSGCGNDTASERKMFSKYMVDSVMYWATEYHIDGFRFDLMGLHDVDTMNKIRDSLDTLEDGEKLLMYGEAWKLNTSADEGTVLANQSNVKQLSDRIAAFDDTYRDAIKGSTSGIDTGFVQTGEKKGNLETGIRGQSDGIFGWANTPNQVVTYASCHDNLTLWDKLVKSQKGDNPDYNKRYNDIVEQNKLAAAVTFTSQGASFILAGEEFCRTKEGDENSYSSGVRKNMLDWSSLYTYGDVSDYYRGLIKLRKNVDAFRDPTAETANSLEFFEDLPDKVLAYSLYDNKFGNMIVAFNADDTAQTIKLDGEYVRLVDKERAGVQSLGEISDALILEPKSAAVLADKEAYNGAEISSDSAKVIVRYNENDEVFKSYIINGKVGESYSVSPLSKVLMNYNVEKKRGDSGTFTAETRYCDFECKKYDGAYSSVSFECRDENDKIISDTTVLTNRAGQPYETISIPSVDRYTLNLEKLPKNGCGVFGEKNITVKYYYIKKAKDDKTCRVNIIYMSVDGKVLGTNTLTGDEGSSYSTTKQEIDGYEFKSVTDNNSGSFSLIEKNVLYIYEPKSIASLIFTVAGIILIVAAALGFGFVYYRRRKTELMKKLDIS